MNGTDPLGLTANDLEFPRTRGLPMASTVTGQTGGAVPAGDPFELEYERMGRAYSTAPRGGLLESISSLFGGPETQPDIMARMLKMRPLMQEERAQEQEARKQRHEEEKQRLDVAKYLFSELDKYRQATPEQQAILAPAIERMWSFAAPRMGLSMSPEDVRNMLPRPDLDRVVKGMIGVEPLTRDQQTEAQAAFGAAATSDQRVKVAETLTKRWTAQADADLRQLLPVFVQGNGSPGTGLRDRLGLPKGAVMPYQAFLQGMRDIANSDAPGLKELAGNRFYRDAFTALMKDEEFVTSLGVQSPKGTYKAQEAGGIEAAKMAVTGPSRGEQFNRIVGELFPGVPPAQLTGEQVAKVNATLSERGEKYGAEFNRAAGELFKGVPIEALSGPQMGQVNALVEQRRLREAERRGLGVELEKRKAPLTLAERAAAFHVPTFLATGELVQPPAGMTGEAVNASPDYAHIDQDQKNRLAALKPLESQLVATQKLGARLITAPDAIGAARQGFSLWTGALTGSNPEAKAYRDSSMAFLGNLARGLGGEKGVLTEGDVLRVSGGVVAGFFDTQTSRQIKAAIVNDLFHEAKAALVNQVAGRPTAPNRSRLDALLDRLDGETAATMRLALPPDKRLVIEEATGQMGEWPVNKPLTKGYRWAVPQGK